MKVYLDASVAVRRILKQPGAFTKWEEWEWIVASELLRVEVFRSLDRLRQTRELTVEQLAEGHAVLPNIFGALQQIPLSPAILNRAASTFPAPLGTLDAIHLSTALLWMEDNGEPLTFLTHDRQLAIAARASGLEVKTSP